MIWHVLDAGSIWLKEFASALGKLVPTHNWSPDIRNLGYWEKWESVEQLPDPKIEVTRFPLQRGYARFPIAQLLPIGGLLTERIKARTARPGLSTLICTTPFYAPVAERWPGRVIYYQTDLTKAYPSVNSKQVTALERRMCRVSITVCPNSLRIAEYLRSEAGCDPSKITIIPNATRDENVLDRPLRAPLSLPPDLADLPRPVVGIIGNLAGNMDWRLLQDAINKTGSMSWAFVGPAGTAIEDREQRRARQEVKELGGRVRFIGPKSYGELGNYARSVDAALMPYRKCEPTYSGSATRFYEHLAACRPMLATRGFHELLSKEPLLKLVDTGEEIALELERLRSNGFCDGFEEARWRASHQATWTVRARDLVAAASRNGEKCVA